MIDEVYCIALSHFLEVPPVGEIRAHASYKDSKSYLTRNFDESARIELDYYVRQENYSETKVGSPFIV